MDNITNIYIILLLMILVYNGLTEVSINYDIVLINIYIHIY